MKAFSLKRLLVSGVVAILAVGTAVSVAPTSASAAAARQRVWAGSPVTGRYDSGPPSPPSEHHFLANAADRGNWALDIGGFSDKLKTQDVKVYVAPHDGEPNVITKVDQIGAACTAGRDGAKFVTVGIYQSNGARIGSITYAHINPSVSVGTRVDRWGGKVGKVATNLTKNSACWTAEHVHVQMFSTVNKACYNGTYRHEQPMNPSNFIGRTGGNVASADKQACR